MVSKSSRRLAPSLRTVAVLATPRVYAQRLILPYSPRGRLDGCWRHRDIPTRHRSTRLRGLAETSICLDMDGAQTVFDADRIYDDRSLTILDARTITA
jgi:hypothetical protein